MCQQVHHRNPIFCIVPPYVLDEITQRGTPQQRAAALRTKAVDNTFRALRVATQAARFAPQRSAAPAPLVTPQKRRTIYSAGNTQNLPGTLVRAEGQSPTGDTVVDEAYDGLGATFDFSLRSLTGTRSTIPACPGCHDTFWSGLQQRF
jgi:Zn-dependent metalloprotease